MAFHFRLQIAWIVSAICCFGLWVTTQPAYAQSYGVELQNMLMPASGAMAGTSIAAPQDVISALSLNPAALRQYRGTHFAFGGGWIEPTYNIGNNGGVLPNIGNFQAKSELQGTALGNVGVSQDFSALGRPVTAGIGLLGTAGAGLDVADVPESNGTSSNITILQIGGAVGVDLTDRLAAGAAFGVVSSSFTGLFVGSSKPALDYSVRGNVGLNYKLNEGRRIGAYYQTESSLTFDNAIILQPAGGGVEGACKQDERVGVTPGARRLPVCPHDLFDHRHADGFQAVEFHACLPVGLRPGAGAGAPA